MIDTAGLQIHYVDTGSGDVLLLFPDNLHSSEAYAGEIAHFADRYRVVCFDYPGTGSSTREVKYRDEREYDLWNFKADLACHLLLDLDVRECYVLGSEGGALAALQFAGKQTRLHDMTARGVIADSFLARFDSRTLHRWLDTREHYYVRNAESLREEHGDDWRKVVDTDTAFLRRLADQGGYAVPDFVLNGIPCPTLLTGSLRDPVTPGMADELARLSGIIPECTVFLASHANHPYGEEHPFMWTDPSLFRTVADTLLSRWGEESG
jgi:pimeloyl-ACP methyl ester carboxylesterase